MFWKWLQWRLGIFALSEEQRNTQYFFSTVLTRQIETLRDIKQLRRELIARGLIEEKASVRAPD